jgi:hypothetical protein
MAAKVGSFLVCLMFCNNNHTRGESAFLLDFVSRWARECFGKRPNGLRDKLGLGACYSERRNKHHRIEVNEKSLTGISTLTQDQKAILRSLQVNKPTEKGQLSLL